MVRKGTIFGAIAVFFYISHVVIGGILWESYSHLEQPISDLTASGAPDRGMLSVLTLFYGLFSILFSISAYMYLKKFAPKSSQVGMLLFLTMHSISITYNFFPQDLPGDPLTVRGVMHIVITALIIPLTIISPILVGLGMIKLEQFRQYGYYSILTGVLILIAGGIMAGLIANTIPYFGLAQRINIGALQMWMLFTSVKLFLSDETQLVKYPDTG
ncbi:MAG: DUF998 domain-containing protein [Alkalibacterium sp.]|nr:DUF998 domain-containing protein [Alkalibacterium sp.]